MLSELVMYFACCIGVWVSIYCTLLLTGTILIGLYGSLSTVSNFLMFLFSKCKSNLKEMGLMLSLKYHPVLEHISLFFTNFWNTSSLYWNFNFLEQFSSSRPYFLFLKLRCLRALTANSTLIPFTVSILNFQTKVDVVPMCATVLFVLIFQHGFFWILYSMPCANLPIYINSSVLSIYHLIQVAIILNISTI